MAAYGADDKLSASLPMLTRQQRIEEFGIDCGEGLEWAGGTWGPGGEYIKRLVVKNLSARIVKLRYRLPKTKFFNMDFPDLFKLSPGTFKAIEVRFRPIRLEPYDDCVVFSMGRGRYFKVPICARLSKLAVSLPPIVDFASCPVAEVTVQTFQLRNVGEIPAAFTWDTSAPFDLNPSRGVVAPGRSATITASFSPVDASVVDATAVATITGEQDRQVLRLNITGTGKYPYIVADNPVADFEDVLIGASDERDILRVVTLSNHSDVGASFVVRPVENDREPQFTLTPVEGMVPPGGAVPIRVRYHPASDGMFTCDHFDVVTPGGNTVRITATGTAHGPSVLLFRKEAPARKNADGTIAKKRQSPPNSINFGDVEVGKTVTRVLFLQNMSASPGSFHFQVEDKGVFAFDKIQGVVPPLLQSHVIVSFTPKIASNFYRRVFCLVRGQMPLFLDMLGTGYDGKRRPAPMLQRHVDAFRNRPSETKLMGPPELDEYVAMHGRFDPSEEAVANEQAVAALPSRSGEAKLGPLDVAAQWFMSETDKSRPVYLHDPSLDFGHGCRGVVGERKTCRITNNTRAKITVVMQVPESDDNDTVPDFGVTPERMDIAPGRTGEFRVAFMPTQDNFYYSQEIEAYAFFKSNRTFRLVNDASFTPPWCMPVRAFGHTFALGAEQYMSKVGFALPKPYRISFPPCHVGDCVYQTFEMFNTHDTPAAFHFRPDPTGVFTVKPAEGLIPLSSNQLVTVCFRPHHAQTYTHSLGYTLNNTPDRSAVIRLFGAGCQPRVALEDNGVLYFKPTCLGVTSTRVCRIRNTSRIPVRYEWKLPQRYAAELAVEPVSGILRGNEVLPVKWTFGPSKSRRYSMRVPCLVTSADAAQLANSASPPRPAQKVYLQALGQGTTGALKFDPPALQFGTALVATKVHRRLVLENQSDATLHFRIRAVSGSGSDARELDLDSGASARGRVPEGKREEAKADNSVLVVSHPTGVVEARSRLVTTVVFAPQAAGEYAFRLSYEILATREKGMAGTALPLGDQGMGSRKAVGAPAHLDGGATADVGTNADPMWCGVVGKAGYPTMTWEDARVVAPTSGSGAGSDAGGSVAGGTAARMRASVGGPFDATATAGGVQDSGMRTGHPAAAKALAAGFSFAPASLVDLSCPGSPWRMWRQLSLRQLNACLSTPLTAADLAFNAATQLKQRPEDLETFVFDFSPAPLGSPSMVVLASVRNTGRLHTDFSFRLPNEMEVELEPWAEVGEPTDEDLAQNAIIDAKVFDIQPRRGSLGAGESTTLRLLYNYNTLAQGGRHQVYVTLKLDKGKQVRILLRGRTLEPSVPLLHLGDPTCLHTLAPVPIGVVSPPVQSVPLYNAGGAPLRFMVDDAPLRALADANYGFEVLRCLDRDGYIGAGERGFVRFLFRPLEARAYDVSVDIVYTGDDDDVSDEVQRRTLALRNEAKGGEGNAGGGGGGGIVTLRLQGSGFRSPLGSGGADVPANKAVSVAVGPPGLGMGGTDGLEEDDEDNDTAITVAATKELGRALTVLGSDVAQVPAGAPKAAASGIPAALMPNAAVGATPPDACQVSFPSPDTPEAMASLSVEWLRFGDLPRDSVSYRLVVIRNTRPVPADDAAANAGAAGDSEDEGAGVAPSKGSIAFAWDSLHPLVARRLVRIHPSRGRLAAGEHAVCKVTFSARCDPEVIHTDIACVVSVPTDEVRAEAEATAARGAEAAFKEQKRKLRQRSKVEEAPHQSVMFRSTASRQAHLAATSGVHRHPRADADAMQAMHGHTIDEYGDGLSRSGSAMPRGAGGAMGTSPLMFTGSIAGAQSAMRQSPTRATTSRSVRSRLSRGMPQQGPLVVPPAPTSSVSLHINGRVCSHQEFLLVHSRSRLAAFFNPKPYAVDGDEAITAILDDTDAGGDDGASVASSSVAAPPSQDGAVAALQDVMASLLSDLVYDPDVADAVDDMPADGDVPLFGQIRARAAAAQAGAAAAGRAQALDERARLRVLACSEGAELVERILENTVLNILKEASFEEFPLTQPPVSLVRL